MSFKEPTYKEFKSATIFARLRYRYGLIIVIMSYITLLLLVVYVVIYSQELSTNPLQYAAKKVDANVCYCITDDNTMFIFNKTSSSYIKHGLG